MADEAALLHGSYLTNPNLATPHDTPSFLRSAALRVVTGIMLSSAVMASLCALLDTQYRFDCVLSAAVCWVAAYHYSALTSLRSQSIGIVKLVPPGPGKDFGTPTPLRLAWQEAAADAIRHSDWVVTLPLLLMELHALVGWHTKWFSVTISIVFIELMVGLGAYTRLGVDELAPPRTAGADMLVRASGLAAFIVAWVLMILVLLNLLLDSESTDKSGGYVWVFSLPWIGYGIVSLAAIIVRQFYKDGYPEWLAIFKDVAYAALDNWSKGAFAFYVVSGALGVQDKIF